MRLELRRRLLNAECDLRRRRLLVLRAVIVGDALRRVDAKAVAVLWYQPQRREEVIVERARIAKAPPAASSSHNF